MAQAVARVVRVALVEPVRIPPVHLRSLIHPALPEMAEREALAELVSLVAAVAAERVDR